VESNPLIAMLVAALLSVAAAVPASTTGTPSDPQTTEGTLESELSTEASGAEAADAGAAERAEQWGVEVTSIRLTAHDHMIDFRYRILDPVKAKELFVRQNKPALIHQETGKVLAVPETAKVGPLRNSNQPQQGKIYWMFFGNAGNLVKRGDQVTVAIGDFRAEDLVVE
jgi:hypothetical protein